MPTPERYGRRPHGVTREFVIAGLVVVLLTVPALPMPPSPSAGPAPSFGTGPYGRLGASIFGPGVLSRPASSSPGTYSINASSEPDSAVFDPSNGFVYVSNFNDSSVSVLNGIEPIATIDVGIAPDQGTYDPWNGWVYIPDYGSAQVSILNGTSVVQTVSVGLLPYCTLFDPADGEVYVANDGSDNVSVLQGTSVVGSIAVGSDPVQMAFDPIRSDVVVPNRLSGNVSLLQGTGSVGSVAVGSQPDGAIYDPFDGEIYVSVYASSTVAVLNGTQLVASVGVGRGPGEAAIDEANGTVVVPDYGANAVSILAGTSVVASVRVGRGPTTAIDVATDGTVDVVNSLSDNVSVLNGSALVRNVPVGGLPEGPAVDERNGWVYVPNFNSANVTALVKGFLVTADEDGLPNGTTWWVNVSSQGSTVSSSTSLAFFLPNGSFAFTASSSDRTYGAPPGTIRIAGGPTTVRVDFGRLVNAVDFNESGLVGGTNWSVSLGGVAEWSTTPEIEFREPNGSYLYSIAPVQGYRVAPSNGTLDLRGSAVPVEVNFSLIPPPSYSVTFTESGLPGGTLWSIVLGGRREFGLGAIPFSGIVNGTVPFWVPPSAGFSPLVPNGSVEVHGASVHRSVAFAPNATTTVTGGLSGAAVAALVGIVLLAVGAAAVLVVHRSRGRAPPGPR